MSNRTAQSFNAHRRTFLRSLGIAAGAAAMNPMGLIGGTQSHASSTEHAITRMPRIGLVMPGASSPGYSGEHFTSGFTCYLDEAFGNTGVKTALVVEEGEHQPHKAAKQIAQMIESGAVDIVVAPLNPYTAARLHPVLEAQKRILISVDTGANVVRGSEQSPYVFHSTLSHWRSAMELGRHAVTRGARVMIASSVYESGYDALYALRLGIEDAGGTVADTHITHSSASTVDMKAAIERIRAVNPDVVCAMYSGADAESFLKLYTQSGLSRRIPLVASSFTVADAVLRAHGVSADGVGTCSAWSRELATAANRAFVDRYEQYAHTRADVFGVLGYDTARIIVEGVRASHGAATGPDLATGLCAVTFVSPRGTVSVDARTHSVETPLYLCEVRGNGRGSVHTVSEKIDTGSGVHASLAALEREMRTGLSLSHLTA